MPRQPRGDAAIAHAFGGTVRRRRREAGLSQEELAERADVHRTFVGRVERGETSATVQTIVKLARALDVKPADLMRDL